VPFSGCRFTQTLISASFDNILPVCECVLPSLTQNFTQVLCSLTEATSLIKKRGNKKQRKRGTERVTERCTNPYYIFNATYPQHASKLSRRNEADVHLGMNAI
jgi:superfamily I DNA/RNA helicase